VVPINTSIKQRCRYRGQGEKTRLTY